ncbi:glycosyltransferase [Pseudoduganella danionis]|uniref:glycosyltransferase n=1 Tax=Pseudoduganella danionis TaxID=1890295 RepID=UPI0035B2544B
MARKKILFVAEAVTLAHVGRPLALARMLSPVEYELHFACAGGYSQFFPTGSMQYWPLHSISSAQFLGALAAGKPVYDVATLQTYVAEDRRLLERLRPDAVIGDFRLSLAVSARLLALPYIGLINAYWSPYVAQQYTVPAIALARLLPIALANRLFRAVRPLAFALHSVPLNQLRRRYRLPTLPYDLRSLYADADQVLYPDVAEMFTTTSLPANHAYLGPVTWSPPTPEPLWWHGLPQDLPLVYVTLGSSGQGELLPLILQALASLPIRLMVATAGQAMPDAIPDNAFVAQYLPGERAAQRAQLVICNGGSPSTQQALAAGVPVLGIAGNLDQYLNMQGVLAVGAGRCLRSDRLQASALRESVMQMLVHPGIRAAAAQMAKVFQHYDVAQRLLAALDRVGARVVSAR